MRKLIELILIISLTSCSVSHEIKIQKEPCFYPYKNYLFVLCEDFVFSVNGEHDLIPVGFTTDWATIPRALWSIYSPTKTDTISAAVIHDYLYTCPNNISRKDVDSIFYDALVLHGLNKRTAFGYWLAVRLFGRSHFNYGVTCKYANTGTKNSNSHMRMAIDSKSNGL